MTKDQEIARVFQHETNHNTDSEFIQDLKNKREGKKSSGIGPHDNIIPQQDQVIKEINKLYGGSAGSADKKIINYEKQ